MLQLGKVFGRKRGAQMKKERNRQQPWEEMGGTSVDEKPFWKACPWGGSNGV